MRGSKGLAGMLMWCVMYTSAPAFGAEPPPAPANKVASDDLANQAYEAYSRRDFAQAVSLYLRAHQASPLASAEILYNIAKIYDVKLNDPELATDFYRRFLRAPDADADLVRRATDRVNALRADKEPAPTASAPAGAVVVVPVPYAEPPPDGSGRAMRVAGLVVGGAGILTVGVGAVFGLTASSKNNDAKALCNGDACTSRRAITLTDEASTAATASTVLVVGGGIAVVAGAALFLLAPSRSVGTASSLRVEPRVGTSAAGLEVSGVWL